MRNGTMHRSGDAVRSCIVLGWRGAKWQCYAACRLPSFALSFGVIVMRHGLNAYTEYRYPDHSKSTDLD
jgi:hypothetical protein